MAKGGENLSLKVGWMSG